MDPGVLNGVMSNTITPSTWLAVFLFAQSSRDLSIKYEGMKLPDYQTNMVIMSLANLIKPLFPNVHLGDCCSAWPVESPANPICVPESFISIRQPKKSDEQK